MGRIRWSLYKCISANDMQIHHEKEIYSPTFICNIFHAEQAYSIPVAILQICTVESLLHVFFYTYFPLSLVSLNM